MSYTYDPHVFRETFESTFTWLNGFLRNVRRFGNRPALHCPLTGRRWTYRTLNADANRLASALRDHGLCKNDVLMYMLFNSAEFVFCYLAGHKSSAISCPVNYRQSPGEIALTIDNSTPAVFVYDAAFRSAARQALSMAKHKPKLVLVTDITDSVQPEADEFRLTDFMAKGTETDLEIPEKSSIYDETLRLYTSGTTNLPKGVPLNSLNEVFSSHDVMMHFPLSFQDRTMNMTPWFHRGGLHSGGPTPTLFAGGEVIILRDFHPRRCLQYAEQYKVTFLIGVPTIISMLARAQENSHADLSSLHGIVTMGSPFEKAACEKYSRILSSNIFNGYGTTETFWNSFLRPSNLPAMAGTAGQACTDDDVRVVRMYPDKHAEPSDIVAHDNREIGEIIIQSPAKSAYCYFDNPAITAEKFYKGFFYTGDAGTWDENEFVTVAGRKDDMIISAGENIYPVQIEEILNAHPKIAESAVIGIPETLHGQCLAAYIVPADSSLTVDEVRKYCFNHPMLASFQRPKRYYLVKSLPHTATGKLMHYKLRKDAEAEKHN